MKHIGAFCGYNEAHAAAEAEVGAEAESCAVWTT